MSAVGDRQEWSKGSRDFLLVVSAPVTERKALVGDEVAIFPTVHPVSPKTMTAAEVRRINMPESSMEAAPPARLFKTAPTSPARTPGGLYG